MEDPQVPSGGQGTWRKRCDKAKKATFSEAVPSWGTFMPRGRLAEEGFIDLGGVSRLSQILLRLSQHGPPLLGRGLHL